MDPGQYLYGDATERPIIRSLRSVLTQVRVAYVEKLAAGREVTASKEVVTIAEKSLDAAKSLRQKGAGTEPDLLQAQVELDQAKLRLETAKRRS